MKSSLVLTVGMVLMGAMAFAGADAEEQPVFRLQAAGFGRHGVKAAGDRETVYGADLDAYFSVLRTERFNWWVGVGGGWAPEQDLISDSSCVMHENVDELGTSIKVDRVHELKLRYGELRLMTVPEWKATDWLSVGLRLGMAFDFVRAKGVDREERTTCWAPYLELPDYRELVGDGVYDADEAVVVGIVGLQATVMPWDHLGFYGSVDARFGGDVDIGMDEKVELDSLQWNVGMVLEF